jgi:hypothetical protein
MIEIAGRHEGPDHRMSDDPANPPPPKGKREKRR